MVELNIFKNLIKPVPQLICLENFDSRQITDRKKYKYKKIVYVGKCCFNYLKL